MFDFMDSNKKILFYLLGAQLCHKPFSPTPDDPEFASWNPDTHNHQMLIQYSFRQWLSIMIKRLVTTG